MSDGIYEECPICGGLGHATDTDSLSFPCPVCDGEGIVPHECPA